MIYSILDIVFFFFQAEDGIRDATVTGVQTCALPISAAWTCSYTRSRTSRALPCARSRRRSKGRSEERRVGKERRSRWSPYHSTKYFFAFCASVPHSSAQLTNFFVHLILLRP